ncbi:MAG: DUF4381 domain-containing protein [Akkermansiaceae bacterium]|jgi:hypothetical protein|nr:DUF4381 domain-containing protein [Akkermansiaceae bacterium]
MSKDPTSLDRLHDIAMPQKVSWWPLAPGWYVVIGIVLAVVIFFVCRAWKSWRADAYRRAALRELAAADDVATIAEILRRTALSVTSRHEIAGKTGTAWLDWLASKFPETMPESVRHQLSNSIYSKAPSEPVTSELRDYASSWIAGHQHPPVTGS